MVASNTPISGRRVLVEVGQIRRLLISMARDVGMSDPEYEERSIDLPIYGYDPEPLLRLVFVATLTAEGPLPAPASVAGFLESQGFVMGEPPSGEPQVVEGHNKHGANIWITWWATPDELEIRVELPPSPYQLDDASASTIST